MRTIYLEGDNCINSIIYGQPLFTKRITVYLHGAGEFGSGFDLQFQYPGFATLLRDNKLNIRDPFIIACCQNGEHWDPHQIEPYLSELSQRFRETKIDLIGYSRGGTGVYSYINTYFNVNTATIINSKPPTNSLPLEIPVHIICSEDDHISPVGAVKQYLSKSSSENIRLSLVKGDHYSIESIARSGLWMTA